MTTSRPQRRSLGAVAALVAALLVSSPAVAASWSRPFVYADPDEFVFGGQLVALSESKLVVAHAIDDPGGGWNWTLRRSTDGGRTWSSPIDTAEVDYLAIAGDGDVVDRVQLADNRVWYSRSTDAAVSFGRQRRISPRGHDVVSVHVDRGADGVLAIVWDVARGGAYSRVSTDGGLSFGATHRVAKTSSLWFQIYDVAVGDGAIYVAHINREFGTGAEEDATNLKVRRSTDGGQTWSRGKVISDTGDLASLDAEGTQAFIAYTEPEFDRDESSAVISTIHYRATSNSGRTWTRPRLLPPATWDSEHAVIALQDGVLHALFDRCDFEFDVCANARMFYRRSTDGVSWSDPERVSPKSTSLFVDDIDIAAAGDRVFATYDGQTSTGSRGIIHRRNP